MKKPTSLYLNELQVNRVARRLEKALDGHGSLSGFFTWLEERAYASLMEGGECKDPSSERAWEDYFRTINRWHHQGEQEAMAAYRQAWERLTEKLPWHRENPAASHVLALFVLKGNRALWDRPRGVKPYERDYHLVDFLQAVGATTQQMLDAFRRLAQLPEQKAASPALLWLSNRLEVLREPPRPRPVSFYFEEAAHAVMLRVFKGTLFDRLLGALDELLEGWEGQAQTLKPQAHFLENPMAFFERYPFKTPPIESLQPIFFDWVFRPDNDLIKVLTPEDRTWLAELFKLIDVYVSELIDVYASGYEMPLSEKSEKLSSEVLARIEERLGKEWLSQALYKSEELVADYAFRLVLSLNLVNFRAPQETPTPEQVLGAFMSRYGLSELRPERRLMYRVIKHLIPLQDRDRIRDPLEFHALRLLQAYALEVLPEDEREPERVSHPVLGILGQTDLFPVRDILEAWTGMRVRLEGPDRWRLFKGRKLWGELTHQQAYRAAALLRSMAEPFHTLEECENPHLDRHSGSLGWLTGKEEAPPRVAYPLGAEPLERALEVLAAPTPPFEGEDPHMRFYLEQRHAEERLFAELEKHAVARDK